MTNRISRRVIACALLASTSLTVSTALRAETAAPKFIDVIDDHGVDLTTGLPFFSMQEGSIGSGPGRVSVHRIWAEGAGWVDNWSGGLYPVTSGGVTKMYVQFQGISETFSGSGTSWTSDKAEGATLTVDGSGYWYYTARDGTQIKFDVAQTSNVTHVAMNCPGANPYACQVPLSITHPNGLIFTLSWFPGFKCTPPGFSCTPHTWSRLASVTSSAGYKVTFAYPTASVGTDAWFQRASATFTNTVSAPSPAPVVSYAYPDSSTVSVTDAASRAWVFTTDLNYRLSGVKRPGSSSNNVSYGYGTDGTVNSSTKDGVTNSYSRSVVGSTATETVTDPLTHQTVVVSDINTGRPTSYKDPLNRTTSYAYDTNARLTNVTAPEGNYAQYAYDGRGNVTSSTSVAKSGSGLSNIVTSASFDTTCSNIVTCNKPNSITDAKGNVTDYTYDSTHGGVLTTTAPAPTTGAVRPQVRYSYAQTTGATGALVYQVTGVSECRTSASCAGTGDEVKASAAYNSNLLPTSVTRQDGAGTLVATSSMTYDPRGNLLSVDGPLSGTADTIAFKYDSADQRIGTISPDPDGAGALKSRAMRLTYRADGQVSKQELGTVNSQSDTDWAAFSTAEQIDLVYDANSRLATQQLSSGGTAYALTQFSYDSLGRPDCVAVRMNPSIYASLPSSACTLGTAGSYGNDRISQTVYDNASEPTQLKEAVGTSDAATERTLTYSNDGLVTSLTDAESNKTTYVYDGFDRLSQTQYPSATKGAGTSNSSDYEQLGYDANSNVTSRRLRDGNSIGFTFDNLNRPTLKDLPGTEPDVTYAYDNLGRLNSASQTGNALSFSYDALGRKLTEVGPQGTVTSAYDLAGRRTQLTYPGSGLYVNTDYLVTGEPTAIRENGATSGVGVLASYAYDDLGNRTSVTFGNGVSQAFTFDAVSRLASLTNDLSGTTNDLSTTLGYNAATQIAQTVRTGDAYAFTGHANVNRSYTSNGLNQYSAAGSATLTYDARGNLTSDGTNSYGYSSENLLTSGPGSTSLAYDPALRLYQLAGSSTTSRFAYDGLNMIADYDGSNTLQHRYVFGPGADAPIVEYAGSGSSSRIFLSSDERGSIVSRTDSSGTLSAINSYDEYGVPGSSNAGRFQYTGQMWLPEIGLQYSKARTYSPTLGRFLQTDPIGNADNANLYQYVQSDPINSIDPLGLQTDGYGPPIYVIAPHIPGKSAGGQEGAAGCGPQTHGGFARAECGAKPGSGGGHAYEIRDRICTAAPGKPCHIERTNREICVLPGHISTDPIVPGDWYAVYGSYGDLIPQGFVTVSQTGTHSFRNATTWLHPLSGTIDRIFTLDAAGNIDVTTSGRGRAATQLQDDVNDERGPDIFHQQDDACSAILGGTGQQR